MLFEFENAYNLDTGDLLQIFRASGVHLQKDVSLSFSFTDPQGKQILSDVELRDNPLIKDISYDILDTGGNVVYENYLNDLVRTFTLKEIDNISLFGEYRKDFGIRATVSNFMNDNKFISEYYVYGNVPKISGVLISDGSGVRKYDEYLAYESIDTGILNDKIQLNIEFSNDARYISYDYIDVYASYDQDNVEIIDENFVYRYPILNNTQAFQFNIDQNFLSNGEYNLAIIPYSKIGSGESFHIKPAVFSLTPEVAVPTPITQASNNGISFTTDLITGTFLSNKDEIIDTLDITTHNIFKYTTRIIDNDKVCSSELKVIVNGNLNLDLEDIKPQLIEYGFNEDNFINYKLSLIDSSLYLVANGASEGASYTLHKFSM
jgi:hypothetical protein